MSDEDSDYHVERVELGDGRAALRFAGELRFRQCFASWAEVRGSPSGRAGTSRSICILDQIGRETRS